jgi:hypothetical protein
MIVASRHHDAKVRKDQPLGIVGAFMIALAEPRQLIDGTARAD